MIESQIQRVVELEETSALGGLIPHLTERTLGHGQGSDPFLITQQIPGGDGTCHILQLLSDKSHISDFKELLKN